MSGWKHNADYFRKQDEEDERRIYGAEMDYLHNLHVKRESDILTDVDLDEHETKSAEGHKTKSNVTDTRKPSKQTEVRPPSIRPVRGRMRGRLHR